MGSQGRGRRAPRAQLPRCRWAHRWWQTQTNLTGGRGRLHWARHGWQGVKVQVQQTGLLRERPWGLKLGGSGRGGRQLVTESTAQAGTVQTGVPHREQHILARHPGARSHPTHKPGPPPQAPAAGQPPARRHQPARHRALPPAPAPQAPGTSPPTREAQAAPQAGQGHSGRLDRLGLPCCPVRTSTQCDNRPPASSGE